MDSVKVGTLIHKEWGDSLIPMFKMTVEHKYDKMFSDIGVTLQVFKLAHPEIQMIHVEANDSVNNTVHGAWSDRIDDAMDQINESIKAHRS